ncbi:MAG: flagellar motor protein MotB [Calditrichia bacterium]
MNIDDYDDIEEPTPIDDEVEEAPAWITTFSDLMSLLLTFFVLMFSMASLNEQKFKQVLESVQSALGVQQIPEAGTREGLEMLNKEGEAKENAIDELGGLVTKEMEEIRSEIEEFILKNKLGGKVISEIDGRGPVITISDVVIFPVGDAGVTRSGLAVLDKIIDILKQFPYRVRVEGHTDNIPIHTAKYPSNWELSTARAATIVRYFISKGIDPSRLSAEGYAHYRPIASNDTPEGRAKNRRVEIVYIREDIIDKMAKRLHIKTPDILDKK